MPERARRERDVEGEEAEETEPVVVEEVVVASFDLEVEPIPGEASSRERSSRARHGTAEKLDEALHDFIEDQRERMSLRDVVREAREARERRSRESEPR